MRRIHLAFISLLLAGAAVLGALGTRVALAAWPHDPGLNLPVCTAVSSNTQYVAGVPDGSGGAILTWHDQRGGGGNDIYAQHVLATGAVDPAWPANGRALCTASNYQNTPVIAADGAGGAIVAWTDFRTGTGDIYAQRVLATGVVDPMWPADGRAVCTAAFDQQRVTIVSDGSGGAILTWEDVRSGGVDIYAHHVLPSGAVDPAWPADGRAVCTNSSDQYFPVLVSDGASGANGAILAWQDSRNANLDVYAHHLRANGTLDPAWPASGTAVCTATGTQQPPVLTTDGASGAIVAWADLRGGGSHDIYAQHVMAAGYADPIWPTDGRALCLATGNQTTPVIVSDGVGGAIVAWDDRRTAINPDIYAQHVLNVGAVDGAWPVDGRAVCAASATQSTPAIASDGTGGAIIAWADARNGDFNLDVFAQRVLATGVVDATWPANGRALSTATNNQQVPTIVTDGAGGAIGAWVDLRTGVFTLWAQRVARYGVLGTPEPVIAGVRDVPNDQGGKVKLSWDASWLDTDPSVVVDHYWVFRSVPPAAAALAMRNGVAVVPVSSATRATTPGPYGAPLDRRATPLLFTTTLATGTIYWEYVTNQPALHIVSGYSILATTTGDSTGANNAPTQFMVTAWNAAATQYWSSSPVGGYSVDNLPPYTPLNLVGNYVPSATHLHWEPNAEADFANYRVYRGSSAGFTPGPGNLVSSPPDTGYADAGAAGRYYKLSAVDVHGNESGWALLTPLGTTGTAAAPARPALELSSPNPSRGPVTLRLSLPAAGRADLAIHDAAGRRVRTVLSGAQDAGELSIHWDGRDDLGHRLAPGLYFMRLETNQTALTRRIVRLE